MPDSLDESQSYCLVERLSDARIVELCGLYQREFWSKGRTVDGVRRMLENTDVVVAFTDGPDGELVAFARVLTDEVYRAMIYDVIVDASHRGHGLGKLLMDAVVSHPQVRSVHHVELYCRAEMGDFYERWGFEVVTSDVHLMARSTSHS